MSSHPLLTVAGVISTVIAAVLAATGPIFDSDGKPASLPSTDADLRAFSIHVKPLDEFVTKFVVPTNAPLEDMPAGHRGFCNSAQMKWLEGHGSELRRSYAVNVRNTATSGPMLTMAGVRVEDLRGRPAQSRSIIIDCPNAGAADIAILQVDLDSGGQVSLLDEQGNNARPGSLFSFNLAPGEAGLIELDIAGSTLEYQGRLIAEVTVGTSSRQVPIPVDEMDGTFQRPSLGSPSATFSITPDSPGHFICQELSNPSANYICTVADIRRRIRSENAGGQQVQCRSVSNDIENPLGSEAKLVHDAACRRDFSALLSLMSPKFLGGPDPGTDVKAPQELIERWRQGGPEGVRQLEELATLLETKPVADQGGLIYDNGRAVAIFARHETSWSAFYLK